MRDGWEHQAAIHAHATYSIGRPEPVCRGLSEEWTLVVDWSTSLPDHGSNLHQLGCLQLNSGHTRLPEPRDMKERAIRLPTGGDPVIRTAGRRLDGLPDVGRAVL
jgi:hypothetical protein